MDMDCRLAGINFSAISESVDPGWRRGFESGADTGPTFIRFQIQAAISHTMAAANIASWSAYTHNAMQKAIIQKPALCTVLPLSDMISVNASRRVTRPSGVGSVIHIFI
jgi:hypothetical protein